MFSLRDTTRISIVAALGLVLMLLQTPIFPSAPFLKYDAGDIPILIAAFALGPAVGVASAALKDILFLLLHPTPETWVGAPMNFLAGASFAWVAGTIYWRHKSKRRAVGALAVGVLASTAVMLAANVVVLPWFMALVMPGLDAGLTRGMLFGTILPFNLIKGVLDAVPCFVVYKRISPILKAARWELPAAPGTLQRRALPRVRIR